MYTKDLSAIIQEVKSSHSCFSFLKNTLNIPISHQGQAIRCPSFIRDDDHHPSFTAYDFIAKDFSSGKTFDIIDLAALALFNGSFSDALEYLYGRKIWTSHNLASDYNSQRNQALEDLAHKIFSWHQSLLSHPDILKSHCTDRGYSQNFISDYMLGYDEQSQRIIYPFWKNGHFIYYSGRDITGRSKSDKNYPKYKYAKLSDSPIYERCPWGLQSISTHKKIKHSYLADDGNEYDTGEIDPRDTTLCIIEGIPDAASFINDGWQAVSPGGGEFSAQQLRFVLDIAKNYRQVFVCFDNDGPGINFQRKLSRALLDAQIPFICGHVPHEVNGQICKDVNEYYCAGGTLADLVDKAAPGLHELALAAKDISGIAELFRKAAFWCNVETLYNFKVFCQNIPSDEIHPITHEPYAKYSPKLINLLFAQAMKPIPESAAAKMVEAKHTLRYDTAGMFYEYTGGIWQETPDVIIQQYIGEVLGGKASSSRMASIAKYIRAMNADKLAFNTKNVVVFPNGTLHLDSRENPFRKHSPEDMATQIMSYSFDEEARAVKWEKFIYDICGGDPAKIRLMQQIAGYIMYPNNKLQKLFYFIGDGRNGKSVFANILEQVYGPDNCSSVPPSRMGTQFDPIALKNSMLNICYEAKSILNGSEETIKAVASGDPIMAAHKGVDAVSFKTRAKLIVLANKLWRSQDVSYGFLRRILFVKFDQQFMGEMDNKNLYSELLAELPGIFNWCYEGYKDLMKSGEFQEIDDQLSVIDELSEMMSPVSAFVREEMLGGDMITRFRHGPVSDREVYKVYKDWCAEGNFRVLDRIEFMKDMGLYLRQKSAGITIERDESNERRKVFIFTGIPEDEEMEQESTQGRDSRIIALGSMAGTAQGTQEEAEAEENQEDAGENEITGAGAQDVAEVDGRNNDVSGTCGGENNSLLICAENGSRNNYEDKTSAVSPEGNSEQWQESTETAEDLAVKRDSLDGSQSGAENSNASRQKSAPAITSEASKQDKSSENAAAAENSNNAPSFSSAVVISGQDNAGHGNSTSFMNSAEKTGVSSNDEPGSPAIPAHTPDEAYEIYNRADDLMHMEHKASGFYELSLSDWEALKNYQPSKYVDRLGCWKSFKRYYVFFSEYARQGYRTPEGLPYSDAGEMYALGVLFGNYEYTPQTRQDWEALGAFFKDYPGTYIAGFEERYNIWKTEQSHTPKEAYELYTRACDLRRTEHDHTGFHELTLRDWDNLRHYRPSAESGYELGNWKPFKRDYMFYTRYMRQGYRTERNMYYQDAEVMYELVILFEGNNYKPQLQSDWEALGAFFKDYPGTEPQSFAGKLESWETRRQERKAQWEAEHPGQSYPEE